MYPEYAATLEPNSICNIENGHGLLRPKTLKSTQIEWSLNTALTAFDIDNLINQSHRGIKTLFL